MKAVVPIASEDPRFREAGFEVPRPLIRIHDRPVIKWSTDCLKGVVKQSDLVFVVLQSHIEDSDINRRLRELYCDDIDVVSIDGMTEGPAETVLRAERYITADPLVVLFGDQYLSLPLESQLRDTSCDGLLPVFESSDPQWSYARTGSDGSILEIAEKEVISSHAIPGLHYFSTGEDFIRGAKRMIDKDIRTNGIYKVSPVYNEMIEMGRTIKTSAIDEMWNLGSPQAVKRFEAEVDTIGSIK